MLQSVPGKISLTSDCWSSITTDGYISLTAHYLDARWSLQKRILNFSFMPPPHTGVAMVEKIYNLLKDWGIEKKVMSMTLDNASANDAFADCLKGNLDLMCDGAYFHVKCCCHILNLVVQDGLKEVDEVVCKVRETVKYCKGSQARKQRFLDCVAYVSLSSARGLRQDVPTRWNSTFLMLESAIFYRKAFVHLRKTDTNYVNCPTNDEWSRVEKLFKFLKVFYDVTCVFSRSKYPTSNLNFPNNVLKVRLLLKDEIESGDLFVRKIATRMWGKFEKYWSEFSPIMAITAIMYPRYKFQLVDFSYNIIYGSAGSFEVSCLKNKEFDSFSGGEFTGIPKSELALYLEEPRVPRANNLDIIDYWKSCQPRFPVLSVMARDLLSIPISTVAYESSFSVGGKILDPVKSSLKSSVVESLICLRDWSYGHQAETVPELEELCDNIMSLKVDVDISPSPTTTPSPVSASGSETTACSTPKMSINID
ncbi:hypothetical protein SOVF_119460 [Spinacia oleracea]|nr:hypothetical protein SOVF_119460 [Spinacia oleracea]